MEERFKLFVNEHLDYFDADELEYLNNETVKSILETPGLMPGLARQLLEVIGYYDDKKEQSGYELFMNIANEEFGLDKRILEVGGGIIPVLGHKISLRQNHGSITIYDPRLSNYFPATDRFILKREMFNSNTSIKETDLIISFMPCTATYELIDTVTKQQKDFLIAMCEGGLHGEPYDYFESDEEWVSSMVDFAKRRVRDNDMGELIELSFDESISPYPVIYNKRKQ